MCIYLFYLKAVIIAFLQEGKSGIAEVSNDIVSALKHLFLENYSVKPYLEAKCYVRDQNNNPTASFDASNIRDPVQ